MNYDYLKQETNKLTDKIEELRKDINYNDQQVHSRINTINDYLSNQIAKIVLDNATRDAFYNKLVEENEQLKTGLVRLTEIVEGILDSLAKFSSKEK